MKTLLIVLLIGFVAFEVIEHVILPVVLAVFGKRRKATSGAEGMLGKVVEVKRWHAGAGTVSCGGELWAATSPRRLSPGDKAIVEKIERLKLKVNPLEKNDKGLHGGPR